MFHNDVQTQLSNNWKRNTNEHPVDRLFTGYFHINNQMKTSQPNIRSNTYKSETKYLIQRQKAMRSFLNKPDEFEVCRLYHYIQKKMKITITGRKVEKTNIKMENN